MAGVCECACVFVCVHVCVCVCTYIHTSLNSLETSHGYGWRIHCGVEVAKLGTNKQHTHFAFEDQLFFIFYFYFLQFVAASSRQAERVLFIGTQFSILYTSMLIKGFAFEAHPL